MSLVYYFFWDTVYMYRETRSKEQLVNVAVVCVLAADVEAQLGTANGGTVYCLYDYTAHKSDELSFHAGDQCVILRKEDDLESDWWWASLQQKEGYIPKNYIGVSN